MWHSIVGIIITLAVSILAAAPLADAQPPGKKIPRIGYLQDTAPSVEPQRHEAFLQGLRELGWVEGQNIVIEYRYAHGKDDLLPGLAAELVRLQVDLIVARFAPSVRAAKQATSTIPIVMATGGHDPVEAGFVAGLARPGGNVTGVSLGLGDHLSGKWVQLLKDTVPRISRVTVLWDPTRPATLAMRREIERAARSLGLQLRFLEAHGPQELDKAFAAMTREGTDAVVVLPSAQWGPVRRQMAEFMAKSRLPAIYSTRAHVTAGGLMSYGPDLQALMRRAAYYVDRILKGTKPADLPVEEPTQFELVVNLKTANALGLTIPRSLLVLASEVIQ